MPWITCGPGGRIDRDGVAWKGAIIEGRRSSCWASGREVLVVRAERVRVGRALNWEAVSVCRSSWVRARDAISAIECALGLQSGMKVSNWGQSSLVF